MDKRLDTIIRNIGKPLNKLTSEEVRQRCNALITLLQNDYTKKNEQINTILNSKGATEDFTKVREEIGKILKKMEILFYVRENVTEDIIQEVRVQREKLIKEAKEREAKNKNRYLYDKSKMFDSNCIDKKLGFKRFKIKNNFNVHSYYLGNVHYEIIHNGELHYTEAGVNFETYQNCYAVRITDNSGQVITYGFVSNIDLNKMDKDENYRNYILQNMLSRGSLDISKEFNGGYIGEIDRDNKGNYNTIYDRNTLTAAIEYSRHRNKQKDRESR